MGTVTAILVMAILVMPELSLRRVRFLLELLLFDLFTIIHLKGTSKMYALLAYGMVTCKEQLRTIAATSEDVKAGKAQFYLWTISVKIRLHVLP